MTEPCRHYAFFVNRATVESRGDHSDDTAAIFGILRHAEGSKRMQGEMLMALDGSVTDNRAKSRFEFSVNDDTAYLVYERTDDALTLIHTEVPGTMRGLHVGDALVEAALEDARSARLRIVAVCPFARAYMRKHPA